MLQDDDYIERLERELTQSQIEIERLNNVISRLRLALDAATDVGVYPAAVIGGDNPYDKRTEYMEGWNAATTEALHEACKWIKTGDWE